MDELLQLIVEEAESEERSYWYQSGYDAETSALQALIKVVRRVQSRLEEEK